MTALEQQRLIGMQGLLRLQEGSGVIRVRVTIKDAREAFGRLDVLVEPVDGEGTTWVSAERVRMG
jgi:hypothetical protein